MIDKIIKVVELEKQLLIQMNDVMSLQQRALVKLQLADLLNLTQKQEEIAKKIRSLEVTRINMIASMLCITKMEALSITMTELSKLVNHNEAETIIKLRDEMKELNAKFANFALTNRILANRAKNNFSQILSILTNGTNQIYNVKV